jgi:membrane protease YdiL (CAAX protease family)
MARGSRARSQTGMPVHVGTWVLRPSFGIASTLVAYLTFLTAAEVAVTYVNALLVFPLDGGLIAVIAIHLTAEGSRQRSPERKHLSGMLIAFLSAPLIRIISLTLPMAAVDPPVRYVLAGIPMLVGGTLAARAAGLGRRELGMSWRGGRLQLIVIGISVAIGVTEFMILRPKAVGPLPWLGAGFLPAAAVGVFTGFPEELIFRGVMQSAARPLLGRWNWIYVSAVFAVLHVGYGSVADVLFVFGVGLLYGSVVERTRSIIGVSISHGLANVVLLCIAANLA